MLRTNEAAKGLYRRAEMGAGLKLPRRAKSEQKTESDRKRFSSKINGAAEKVNRVKVRLSVFARTKRH